MPENTGNISEHDCANNPEQKETEASGLTLRQRELLMFIRGYHLRFGISPSFQEMMEHMNLCSKSGVHRLVHALAKRGHVHFDRASARSVVPKFAGPSLADAVEAILAQCSLSSSTEAELRALLKVERSQ